MEHLGTGRRQLEHLLIGDDLQLAGLGHDARIGAEHAVDVGVDLADVGTECRRQCHGRGVRAAAAQCGDVFGVLRYALEAGDDRDRTRVESLANTTGRDVDDARCPVGGVGDQARLRAGVGARLLAEVVDGHGDQGHGDPLA